MRWLALALFALATVSACSKARNLGTHCRNSDDCGSLTCGWEAKAPKDSAIGQVCTMTCKTSEDCVADFGDSTCLEGLCVRECRQDADCPAQTYCIRHAYCGR
jgi:hypothetical protein